MPRFSNVGAFIQFQSASSLKTEPENRSGIHGWNLTKRQKEFTERLDQRKMQAPAESCIQSSVSLFIGVNDSSSRVLPAAAAPSYG